VDDPEVEDGAPAPDLPLRLAAIARSISGGLASPDVVAVQGVETLAVLQDLAAQPELAAAGYQAALLDGADPRGLDVGLLYRTDRVSLRSVESRPEPSAPGRAPLVARLETAASGERLTVIACDFQTAATGPEAAALRMALADHVRALADEARLLEPESALVVMGDLADLEDSPPLQRLSAGLLQDPARGGAAAERTYTSSRDGVSVATDYVLADAALAARVVSAGAVHVNVDWARLAPGSAPGAGPRVADHDPVLLRVRLP
jgi:endonuclease/exonuclease/phosphatase family metal-dependent hydrolase